MQNVPHLGTGFIVNHKILNSVTDFTKQLSIYPISLSLSLSCANKGYTLVNVHTPINQFNRWNPEKTDNFWEDLEDILSIIPERHITLLLGDSNTQLGGKRKYRNVLGDYLMHK